MTSATWRSFARLAVAARVFALAALAAPMLWARNSDALPYLGMLALVWALGAWAHQQRTRFTSSLDLVEAALVGGVAGLALESSPGLLAALALPPFLSGLRHGTRGAFESLAAELAAVVGVASLVGGGLDSQVGLSIFTWAIVGLGLGLVAGFVHSITRTEPDPLAAYRNARQLLRGLLDLSGGLSSGLDPVSLGDGLLGAVLDGVPAAALALHVPRGEELTPLARKVTDPALAADLADALAPEVMSNGRILVSGSAFAFPLTADGSLVGVVTGLLSTGVSPSQIGLEAKLQEYARSLGSEAVRLDTALLFGALRDAATSDERRRLAREMHDGVAQDIASMGYLVDALAATETRPPQSEQLRLLRDGITSVVAEVRRSVLTLRSGVDGNESLGAAIGSLARHLSAMSGVPIKVTVDESTTRLRPEVEAELMRITQEALNNAVRHAEASRIDVVCRVSPPEVAIVVADNGRGLQQKRVDSHGLEIMNERARLIGAVLDIGNRPEGGAQVSVRIGGEPATSALTQAKESVAS